MPRTYGEVLACSFGAIFNFGSGDGVCLVDIGSGHGSLVRAAVEEFGCCFGLGVEKYAEPAKIAAAMHASLPVALQSKTKFIVEDCNDTVFSEALVGIKFDKLIIFCNNLAFHAGTVHRFGQKCRHIMEVEFPDKEVIVISALPMERLADRHENQLALAMTWAQEPHMAEVYRSSFRVG